MIIIQGVGKFNTALPFFEQEDENVLNYLINVASQFNDATALEKDKYNRPLRWKYEGEGIIITSERTYLDESGDYFVKEQTFNIKENGNI